MDDIALINKDVELTRNVSDLCCWQWFHGSTMWNSLQPNCDLLDSLSAQFAFRLKQNCLSIKGAPLANVYILYSYARMISYNLMLLCLELDPMTLIYELHIDIAKM